MAVKYLKFQSYSDDGACFANSSNVIDNNESSYAYINVNTTVQAGGLRLYNLETVGIEWSKIQSIKIYQKIKHFDYNYPATDLFAHDFAQCYIYLGNYYVDTVEHGTRLYTISNGGALFTLTQPWNYVNNGNGTYFWYYSPYYGGGGNPTVEHWLEFDITSYFSSLAALQAAQFEMHGTRGTTKSATLNSYFNCYDFKLKITYKDDGNILFRSVI